MRLRALVFVAAAIVLSVRPSAQDPAPPGAASTTGAITPPLSPRNANYSIDARLDANSRTITGSELITWRNITTRTAADLQFHLYWNAWKNAESTFMRERALGSGAQAADRTRRPEDWSHIDVSSIKLVGTGEVTPADLTASQHY